MPSLPGSGAGPYVCFLSLCLALVFMPAPELSTLPSSFCLPFPYSFPSTISPLLLPLSSTLSLLPSLFSPLPSPSLSPLSSPSYPAACDDDDRQLCRKLQVPAERAFGADVRALRPVGFTFVLLPAEQGECVWGCMCECVCVCMYVCVTRIIGYAFSHI